MTDPQDITPELLARIRTKTIPHDPARHLTTRKGMAAYLKAALEDGDPRGIAMALGITARARARMAKEAEEIAARRPLDTEKVKGLTSLFDAAEYLKTESQMAAYLEVALKDGDPRVIASVQDDITRARARREAEGRA